MVLTLSPGRGVYRIGVSVRIFCVDDDQLGL